MTLPQKPVSSKGSSKGNLQKRGSGMKSAPTSSTRENEPVVGEVATPETQSPDSIVSVNQSGQPIVTVVDEKSTKGPKAVDYNPAKAHDETRHLIVKSLLEIIAFVVCAALLFCFWIAQINDDASIKNIEKIFPVIDHYLSLLITLLSGVIGFYFGSKINTKKSND